MRGPDEITQQEQEAWERLSDLTPEQAKHVLNAPQGCCCESCTYAIGGETDDEE